MFRVLKTPGVNDEALRQIGRNAILAHPHQAQPCCPLPGLVDGLSHSAFSGRRLALRYRASSTTSFITRILISWIPVSPTTFMSSSPDQGGSRNTSLSPESPLSPSFTVSLLHLMTVCLSVFHPLTGMPGVCPVMSQAPCPSVAQYSKPLLHDAPPITIEVSDDETTPGGLM